jgi:pimeloyl-ACP methyl ester carboxylesterase
VSSDMRIGFRQWTAADPFAESALDLPGFCRSERRTELLSRMAMSEFLVRPLDEWGIENPHLVCPDVGTTAALFDAPDIDAFRSLDPRELVQGAVSAMGSAAPAADVVDDYIESNMGDRFAEAARYVRSYPEQLRLLADLLPQIFTPVQIITGRWDPLVPLANAEYLHTRLPNSRLDVLDTGHFVWVEAPDQYGAIVAAWVNGCYLAGGSR